MRYTVGTVNNNPLLHIPRVVVQLYAGKQSSTLTSFQGDNRKNKAWNTIIMAQAPKVLLQEAFTPQVFPYLQVLVNGFSVRLVSGIRDSSTSRSSNVDAGCTKWYPVLVPCSYMCSNDIKRCDCPGGVIFATDALLRPCLFCI